MKKNNQELQESYLEFQALNQQINQLQQQFNSINNNTNELKNLEKSLDEIKKENKILIPLGNNIFIKGKIEENNEVIIGIGSKILVKKNISETKDTIKKQINELEKINSQLNQQINHSFIRLEELQKELIKESKQ